MLTAIADISSSDGWWVVLTETMEYVPAFILTPRFILSLRSLDARVVRGGDDNEIDTAFGLTSTSCHDSATSAIMFVDSGGTDGEEQNEEIQMEEGGS